MARRAPKARNDIGPGTIVVVTGASSGIGRATAQAFARRGATVVLAARSEDDLRTVVSECQKAGGHALAVPTDLADEGVRPSLRQQQQQQDTPQETGNHPYYRCDISARLSPAGDISGLGEGYKRFLRSLAVSEKARRLVVQADVEATLSLF